MATPPNLWPWAKQADSLAEYRTCIDRQWDIWRHLTSEICSIFPKIAAAWRTSKKEASPSTEKRQVASCSGVGGWLAAEAQAEDCGGNEAKEGSEVRGSELGSETGIITPLRGMDVFLARTAR